MADPVVNTETGEVKFPKPEDKVEKAKEKKGYVYLPQATLDKLVVLAKADGFKPDAETTRGIAQQANKAAGVYVALAVEMLLAKRATGGSGQKAS